MARKIDIDEQKLKTLLSKDICLEIIYETILKGLRRNDAIIFKNKFYNIITNDRKQWFDLPHVEVMDYVLSLALKNFSKKMYPKTKKQIKDKIYKYKNSDCILRFKDADKEINFVADAESWSCFSMFSSWHERKQIVYKKFSYKFIKLLEKYK